MPACPFPHVAMAMIGTQQELPFSELHSSFLLTPVSLPPLFLSVLLNLSYHTSFLLFLLSNIVSFTAFTSFLPLALLHFTLQNQSFSEHWVSLACSQLQSRPSIFYIKKLCPLGSFVPWRQRQHRWLPTKLRSVTSQKTVPWSTKSGNKSAQTLHSWTYASSDSKTGRLSIHVDRSRV